MTRWRCGPADLQLAIRGRASNRWLLTCTPLTWLRVILLVSRHGYDPIDTDCHGIAANRAEAFSEALECALLFTPACDWETQVRTWRQMNAVPTDTRLTCEQMALREVLFAMDRDNDLRGWSSPKTRTLLEHLRRFIMDEGGLRLERMS